MKEQWNAGMLGFYVPIHLVKPSKFAKGNHTTSLWRVAKWSLGPPPKNRITIFCQRVGRRKPVP